MKASTRRFARTVLRVVALVGVLALLVVAVRTLDLAAMGRVLRGARLGLLLVALPPLLGANLALRCLRFHALVRALPAPEGRRFTFADTSANLLASLAANNVLPLRLGELARTRGLVARGYALGPVATTQVVEKGVELVTLIATALPLVPLGIVHAPAVSGWVIGIGTALALAVGFVARASQPIASLLRGISPRAIGQSLAASLAADGVELLLIGVCLASVGISPGWREALAVYVGINLAIAIPSTPGQIGAFEAGGALALTLFGVTPERAVAFALLYRVVQWGPTTLVGAIAWLATARTKGDTESSPAASTFQNVIAAPGSPRRFIATDGCLNSRRGL